MRDETIAVFLGQLAARVPAPGGGATAALHAAQSAALVAMVARYSNGARYDAELMAGIITEADMLRDQALTLAEDDAAAFGAVSAAYQLQRRPPNCRKPGRAAIAEALIGAARPPAEVIRTALRVIELAEELLPAGNRNVITDVAAAAEAAPRRRGHRPGQHRGQPARNQGRRDRSRAHRHGRVDRRDRGASRPADSRGRPRGDQPVKLLSGRELAAGIRAATAARAAELAAAGRPPCLAAVTAKADEASAWYLRSLATAAAKAGVSCDIIDLAADSSPAAIARTEAVLTELSGDPAVHGIILATPLPAGARLAGTARHRHRPG